MAIIGIDLGGTNLKAGIVTDNTLKNITIDPVKKDGTKEEVVEQIISMIRKLLSPDISAIGIGVPSIVDPEKGIVYQTTNIPSWDEVPLKDILKSKFKIPVFVNNDANCFALGEKHYGVAQGKQDVVGVIIGTGFGSGLVLNGKLYTGKTCGAGEIGWIPYKESYYEEYCSNKFFEREHKTSGAELFKRAEAGDAVALKAFSEFGEHLGHALSVIITILNPQVIVIGGSISKARKYFEEATLECVQKTHFRKSLENVNIRFTEEEYIAILGAAALYEDSNL